MQFTAAPPLHAPAWQLSPLVHALPSSQGVPFASAGFEHTPVAGLHTPAWWHWSGVGQTTALPPVQTPAWQVSTWVQALPSLHAAPSTLGGLEQPVAGTQLPARWH